MEILNLNVPQKLGQKDGYRMKVLEPIRRILKSLESMPEWKYIAILCGIAFTLRVIWILVIQTLPIDDAGYYDRQAMNLISGKGYVTKDGITPTAYFPPGMAFILALVYSVFGHSITCAKLLNVVLGTATCLIVYLIAKNLLKSTTAQRLSGLLVAVFPGLVAYTSLLYSETVFTFFFMLAVFLVIRIQAKKNIIILSIVTGLITGFACLIRSVLMVFPALLLIYYLYTWRNIKRAVLTAAVIGVFFVLAITPWIVRNYVAMDAFIPISTNGGVNFLTGSNPSANGKFPGGTISFTSAKDEIEIGNEGYRLGLDYALHNPMHYISLIPRKVFYFFASDYGGVQSSTKLTENTIPREAITVLKIIFESWYIVILAVAGIGLFFLNRRKWWYGAPSLLPLIFIYFVAISAVTFGDGRFHMPLLPLISIIAGDTLVTLIVKEHGNEDKAV